MQPKISRPDFPEGYLPENATTFLPWSHVEQRLNEAIHYWMCSVRPDGRPHAVPRWGVWVNGKVYYDGSPQTRHARNIDHNPQVTLHLESGENVLIAEGTSEEVGKPETALAHQIAAAYAEKYAGRGYSPQPDQWDEGGLYAFTPRTVLAWTNFLTDPDSTRFELDS